MNDPRPLRFAKLLLALTLLACPASAQTGDAAGAAVPSSDSEISPPAVKPIAARHAASHPDKCLASGLEGSFIQPTFADARRPAEEWQGLLDDMRSVALREIVLQWTSYDNAMVLPVTSASGMSVTRLTNEAARRGMTLWVGLQSDSRYWPMLKQPDEALQAYLSLRLAQQRALIQALAPIAALPAFAGFYISDEIDDSSWLPPARARLLQNYLKALTQAIHAAAPNAAIAISTFSNGKAAPAQFASFWQDMADQTGIAMVFYQDGIGAGKLSLPDSESYAAALHAALSGDSGRHAGIVTELFRMTASSEGAANVPVSWTELAQQLASESRLGLPLYGFSMPDYMNSSWSQSLTAPAAAALFRHYKDSLCRP